MRSARFILLGALSFSALAAPLFPPADARAAEPEPLAKADELHQLFKEGQYQPLLQKLARVLALKGDAARPYDRVEMLLLRGEALLQLKQTAAALEAMAEAAKAINDQTDPKLAATARATELLVRRSKAFTFTPRTTPRGESPKPINVLDTGQRPAALWGLYNDMLLEARAKVRAASAGKTLPPIVDAVRGLVDLRAVEVAATDKDEQAQALLTGLAARALKLMGDGVDSMATHAADIDATANQLMANLPVAGQALTDVTYHKRGLDTNNTRDLKSIIDDCSRVSDAAKDFADLSKSTADAFGKVASFAEKTANSARRTLEADYFGATAGRPR